LNVEREARVCFEVDEPVKVFDYGRFECDTGLAYRSAIAYGRIRIVDDRAAKNSFFDALLAKYGTGTPGRPKSFYPRLDEVTVYAIAVAHHRQALPAAAALRAVAGARSHQVAECAALAGLACNYERVGAGEVVLGHVAPPRRELRSLDAVGARAPLDRGDFEAV